MPSKLVSDWHAELPQSNIALYHGTRVVAFLYKLLVRLCRENETSRIKIDCLETLVSVQRGVHARNMESMSGKYATIKRDMAALHTDYDANGDKAGKD